MTIALWVIQGLLALMFLMTGATKAFQPMAALAKRLPWTASVPAPLVRFVGVAEILGALGLILPGVTHVATILTPLAAVGLALVMLLASAFHVRRGEYQVIGMTLLALVLALVVVVSRFTAWPLV